MGDIGKKGESVHELTLLEATKDDMTDMAAIFLRALSWEPIAVELDKCMPFDQQVEFVKRRDTPRMTVGTELGTCRTWKVVDEDG